MNITHRPVLLAEAVAALISGPRITSPEASKNLLLIDGTFGRGGHTQALLAQLPSSARMISFDKDLDAIAVAEKINDQRLRIVHDSFAQMDQYAERESVDGILLDLGISSPQVDEAHRGFSFRKDGPLDMRMDLRQPLTAAGIVNGWSEAELARVFWEYGDEPQSRRFARAIAQDREGRRFETTVQLASLIERLAPRHGKKKHPATRVFQALRMAVNDESRFLKSGLAAACTLLKPGGRLAVITFHSLEDRMVKEFGRERAREYTFEGEVDVPELRQPCVPDLRWVQRKAILPGEIEMAENPRSRSAQLRVLEKV